MNIYSPNQEDELVSSLRTWLKTNPFNLSEYGHQKIPGEAYFTGLKHTEETKQKMREAHLGKPKPSISEEHKNKISQANTNRKHKPRSDEWKLKQSLSQKGKIRKPFTQEHLNKLKEARNNRTT